MIRPYCLTPMACTARSEKHCQRCSGTHWGKIHMARLRADPEMLARMNTSGARTPRDPIVTAKRVATLRANRHGLQNIAAAARKQSSRLNGDPAIHAARLAGLGRSVAGRVRRNAERLAARVGIPVSLVEEFRFLRWSKHYSQDGAVALLAGMHPEAFREIRTAQRSAAGRTAGPQPAPGMPERREWIRKATEERA